MTKIAKPVKSEESEWDEFIYDCFLEVFEEIEMNELIEQVAIKIAVVNLFSGGNWVDHYTEDQKEQWRERAKEVIEMVKQGLVK
jgi:hypothetical protein